MKNTIYPEIIDKVLEACNLYIKNGITSRSLQQVIYWAEQSIANFDERELRIFLTSMEGELDSVRALANGINIDQPEEVEDREGVLEIISKIRDGLIPKELPPKPEDPPAWPFEEYK
jgi:hypothetical protein